MSKRSGSVGLVLSGGGARGAYEVGVLTYIAEQMPELLARVRVVTGTSVGAVNCAFLASHGMSAEAVRDLNKIWLGLTIDELVGLDRSGMRELLTTGGKRLIGRPVKSPPVGLLRVDGIVRLVGERADWRGLRKVVRQRRLDAVGFAATEIATGHTVFFVDHGSQLSPRWAAGGDAPQVELAALGPAHVLASAAIPILFPPVAVGGRWFMDGGVRYNTPLGPALSLGAEGLIIVSVRAVAEAQKPAPVGEFSGFGQIVGKVLDSVFLDRIGFDLDRLDRVNDWIDAVVEHGGEAALTAVQDALIRRGRPRYRHVPVAHVRPSSDLGALASEHLKQASAGRPFSFARVLSALFQDDQGTTGDAASFLLFDGGYARTLIEAGQRDAHLARDALAAL